jgi:hypothetical protein
MRQWELFGITDTVCDWTPRVQAPVPVKEADPADLAPGAEIESELLLDGFPSLLWTTDAALCFTSSPGASRAGIPEGSASVMDGFSEPEVVDAHVCAAAGGASTFDLHRNGETLRCWVSPVRSAEGAVCGTICVGLELSAALSLETVEYA